MNDSSNQIKITYTILYSMFIYRMPFAIVFMEADIVRFRLIEYCISSSGINRQYNKTCYSIISIRFHVLWTNSFFACKKFRGTKNNNEKSSNWFEWSRLSHESCDDCLISENIQKTLPSDNATLVLLLLLSITII